MLVYRITQQKYAEDLSGMGTKLFGGRWNDVGISVIYTSESVALAQIEFLKHIDTNDRPTTNFVLVSISIPDESILDINSIEFPDNWDNDRKKDKEKSIGSYWANSLKSLTLRVPSDVVQSYNYLINPTHSKFYEVKIVSIESLSFDSKLISQINNPEFKKRLDDPEYREQIVGLIKITKILFRVQVEKVLGVKNLAFDLAELIKILPFEQGRMIGVFGKWGRGKTVLMHETWEILKNDSNFFKVDFHAWKYQNIQGSWAYLYESFLKSYLGKKKKIIGYYYRLLRLNYKRHGIIPFIKFIIPILLSILAGYGILIINKSFLVFGIPLISAVLFQYLNTFYKEYSLQATSLIKRYTTNNIYKESLGLQAEIQKDLVHLMEIWIPKVEKKKVILFVDDIDRCTVEKVIEIVDSLRVILEEDEIAKRLVVVAGIDINVLKLAIKLKYSSLDMDAKMNILINEYLDKLFIFSIKLAPLDKEERVEYFAALSKGDRKQAAIVNEDYANESHDKQSFDNSSEKNSSRISDPIIEKTSKVETSNLDDLEYSALLECIKTYEHSTPRQIRILYYRYLFAKNLIIKRFNKSIWLTPPEHLRLFILLLINYSLPANSQLISSEKLRLIKNNSEKIYLEVSGHSLEVTKKDCIELYTVLEIVIAY